MLSVADARARARRRLEQDGRDWAAFGGADVRLSLPLQPPTERAVLADQRSVVAWVESWRRCDGVEWGLRSWSSVGRQQVPERLTLQGPDAIAAFAGTAADADWRVLRDSVRTVLEAFPDREPEALRVALKASGRDVAALDEADLRRLVDVLRWLGAHPSSGLRIRQVPVRGVHTKWLEVRRGLVERLHGALSGSTSLGLLGPPVLVRCRVLDPALRPDGLEDLTVPVEQLAALQRRPRRVLVLENLETLLALPDSPGVLALHGHGYGAGPRLAPVEWLREVDVTYWGDLDTHGFQILDQWRGSFPATRSALMDERTLLAHRDLWVDEPKQATGAFARLTAEERTALDRLRLEGGARLEQERVEWQYALEALGL